MPEILSPWLTYQGTKVWRLQGLAAYTYITSHVEIDADGAPNAYHPNDTGLDALANAGFPRGGWRSVLVQDPKDPGQPFVQKAGAFAGFFVSKTTLEDPDAPAAEPQRYVDATMFPYIVFPGAFEQLEGTGVIGDIVLAKHIDAGLTSPAIVADLGPRNAALGEISIRLAANLGEPIRIRERALERPEAIFDTLCFPGRTPIPNGPCPFKIWIGSLPNS